MELGQRVGAGERLGRPSERGYAMAALLVGMSIMAIMMSMAMPVWSQFAKRDKEEELIWRGQQYARAIGLFQRKYANTFPPNLDILLEQRFLRKKFKDPITNDDFQIIPAGGNAQPLGGVPGRGVVRPGGNAGAVSPGGMSPSAGGNASAQLPEGGPTTLPGGPGGASGGSIGIQGVVSKSKDSSIKVYNGRTKYNEWIFVYLATAQRIGPGGAQRPGAGGPQGQPRPSGRPPSPFGPGNGPGGDRRPSPFSPPPSPFGSPPPFGGQQPPGQKPPPGR